MTTKYQKQQQRYEAEKKKKDIPSSWDKASTKWVTYLLIGGVLFFIIAGADIRGYLIRNDTSWASTIGRVQSIEPMEGMDQSKVGNRRVTIGYKIKYRFEVDGVIYTKESVFGSRLKKITSFVGAIKPTDIVEVYYKKENLNESHINIDIDSGFYKNRKTQ